MRVLRNGVIAFAATLGCMLVLDALWLSSTASTVYRMALEPHLAEQPDFVAAGLFYLLYGVGLTVFAVRPADVEHNWRRSLALGVLFGAVAYGTYDLTNQATLAGWPWWLTGVDMIWGSLLSGVSAAVGAAALGLFARLPTSSIR